MSRPRRQLTAFLPRPAGLSASLCLAALLVAELAPVPAKADGALRRGACEPVAYEQDPPAATDASNTDNDSDDEEEKPAADGGETKPFGFAFGTDGCATVEGQLAAIASHTRSQLDDPQLQQRLGQPRSSLLVGSTLTASASQTIGGVYVGTTVSIIGTAYPVTAASFAEASVRVGRVMGGYAPSLFVHWTSDQFVANYLTAWRATTMVAFDLVKPSPTSVTVSLEDPAVKATLDPRVHLQRIIPGGGSTASLPDVVVRTRYETDTLSLHAAAALRPRGSTGASEPGYAFTLGASWTFDFGGVSQTLAGQVMYARDMPRYLGTAFDARSISSILRPDDITVGMSGILSWTQEWDAQWSTGAYVSKVALNFPTLGSRGGTANISRAVANVTYKPIPRTRFAFELSYGSVALDLPDRTNQLFIPSGQSLALSLSTAIAF